MARRAAQMTARELEDDDLFRELRRTWKARSEAVFKGDASDLRRLTERMEELEGEYATRHTKEIEPDPWRTRDGARARAGQGFTGGVPREATSRARRLNDDKRQPQ